MLFKAVGTVATTAITAAGFTLGWCVSAFAAGVVSGGVLFFGMLVGLVAA